MLYLDLAELDAVFARRWLWSTRRPALAWLRRADHLGDPRAAARRRGARSRRGRAPAARPAGPIRMLTHLRYFGHCFNPVSFYYCFDAAGARVESIVAEVNNTPWGERHCYVLPTPQQLDAGKHRALSQFDKAFHVSPFMPMELAYDWGFERRPASDSTCTWR